MVNDRILFSKTGRAKYISHLDLMRTFQRAFYRAKIQIKHTEGFNPHPFVSIALPLSTGFSSDCELLEFGLEGGAAYDEVPERLNAAMPEGIIIHSCYPIERKIKELTYLNYIVTMEYPGGIPEGLKEDFAEFLGRESVVVKKKSNKSKKGYTEVDLIPLIRRWSLEGEGETLVFDAVLSAQNPGLNPELIRTEFCREHPEYAPDFVSVHRREALDAEEQVFR